MADIPRAGDPGQPTWVERMTQDPSPSRKRTGAARRGPGGRARGRGSTNVPTQVVVESMSDFAALCDAHGRVTYVNPALAALLQDAPSLDVPLEDYAVAYGAYRPDGQLYDPRELPLQAAALTQTPQRNVEILFRRPDGTTRLTIFNATPLYDKDGTPLGAVAIGRDVTEEYALAQAREDWLATAAHDLRGPVTAILGNLQLARRALPLLLPEEALVAEEPRPVASTAEMVAQEAEWGREGIQATARVATATAAGLPTTPAARLRRNIELAEARTRDLIRQMDTLLDASAAAVGALAMQAEAGVDLATLAEAAAEHARTVTSRHTIAVEARARPLVHGDRVRLRQVLDNVLANAIKFSPETGDLRITIEERASADTCPDRAEIPTQVRARWAVVTVEDAGLGIPAVDVAHVFERYRRASGAASRVRGTGLGLYSSRAIVEAHGGCFRVERTATVAEAGPDGWHGTVMALALPLNQDGGGSGSGPSARDVGTRRPAPGAAKVEGDLRERTRGAGEEAS